MKKPKLTNIDLSTSDILAILAALPLVPAFGADSDIQQHINQALCLSAAEKLSKFSTDALRSITANEFRVIAASVGLADDFLAGRIQIDLEADEYDAIKPYMFTYSRLAGFFDPVVAQLLEK